MSKDSKTRPPAEGSRVESNDRSGSTPMVVPNVVSLAAFAARRRRETRKRVLSVPNPTKPGPGAA